MLAERAANNLFKAIKERAKNDQILAFQLSIGGFEEFFNVKTIVKDIEEYIVKVAVDFEQGDKDKHPELLKLLEG